MRIEVDVVRFNPDDPETYPSVCTDPGEVKARFGFTGGELLVFNTDGSYVGQLINFWEELAGWTSSSPSSGGSRNFPQGTTHGLLWLRP